MAPGSTVVGELGIIIWVRGMPPGQSAGGNSLQRSPRLNQPLVVGRQERQPARLATTSVIKLSNISFFMALLPVSPVSKVGLALPAQQNRSLRLQPRG